MRRVAARLLERAVVLGCWVAPQLTAVAIMWLGVRAGRVYR